VRLHLPEIKVLVGIWGFSGYMNKAQERFGSARPDALVSSLAQALEQISEWPGQAAVDIGDSAQQSNLSSLGD
jgi:hypothetical protein